MGLLETDPATARQIARAILANHIALENCANNCRRLGFSNRDPSGGGCDRFVDVNVALGDEDAIRKRT